LWEDHTHGNAPVNAPEIQDLGERRETIKSIVLRDGYARIDDLTRLLNVSLMTIHRDLDALAQQGYLTKIRGGATANPSALMAAKVTERVVAMREEKKAIAAHAATLLRTGQTVFLDDSTTAMATLPYIVAAAPITVASNFLPVINKLAGVSRVELIVLGGIYHEVPEACFGSRTIDAIEHLHADLALMSTTGVRGYACYHRSEVTVTSRMAFMNNTTTSVLLVDHAKFGRPATHRLCQLTEFDMVITDQGIDEEDASELRAAGVHLEIAASLRT